MATKPRGGGVKALVAGHKKYIFCGFPKMADLITGGMDRTGQIDLKTQP